LFPATHLSPYQGIESVPPSSFIRIRPGYKTTQRYWDFDPDKRIRYRTDAEYEDHFRTVFQESVRRRLRSRGPVLAELSGGIDSSSIVCVADALIADRRAETKRLDTISYFDDLEPNWNERPYVSEIEKRRGRAGFHIDLAANTPFAYSAEKARFRAGPGSHSAIAPSARLRAECLRAAGYRVVLSGIGGDEVTGGVPTPVPELADLLVRARFRMLAHQLKSWALSKRKPWLHLFLETGWRFLPSAMGRHRMGLRPVSWLDPTFIARQRIALSGYQERLHLMGPLPSFQEALSTLEALRRQIACDELPSDPPYERRIPFLDRDLLEFVFAIPRDQLVRPGERRSLMRRALAGIVPDQVLSRRRKAFVSRAPLIAVSQQQECFADLARDMVAASLGIVNARSFAEVLEKARAGKEVPIVSVFRTLALELWLRSMELPMSMGLGNSRGRVPLFQGKDAPGRSYSLDRECLFQISNVSKERR
jgi:asparagine synthase (glutamine-hydrolysing)